MWLALFQDNTARLGDAALAREAAKAVTDDQRALLGLRLFSPGPGSDVELVIATDRQVIAAQRMGQEPWGVTWSEAHTQIVSASNEKTGMPHVMLRTREGGRALECRQLSGQSPIDYQGKLRQALVTILARRTSPDRSG